MARLYSEAPIILHLDDFDFVKVVDLASVKEDSYLSHVKKELNNVVESADKIVYNRKCSCCGETKKIILKERNTQ